MTNPYAVKTPYWCFLCKKEIEVEKVWYELDVHLLRLHQNIVLGDAKKKYLKAKADLEQEGIIVDVNEDG